MRPEWLAQQVAGSGINPRFAHLDQPTQVPLPKLTIARVVRYKQLWARCGLAFARVGVACVANRLRRMAG